MLSKEKEINGPPAYFTIDWKAAEKSVKALKDLNPQIAASSHGLPMRGKELTEQLANLSNNFANVAVPEHGRNIQ